MGPLLGAVCNLSYFLLFKLPLLSLLFFLTQKTNPQRSSAISPWSYKGVYKVRALFTKLLMPYFRRVLVRFQAGARRRKTIWGRPLSRVFKNPECQGLWFFLCCVVPLPPCTRTSGESPKARGLGSRSVKFPSLSFHFCSTIREQ